MGIGINVILAVSLNLVNGHTGQFSLGHAGFMSVGAYLSAAVTVFLGPRWLGDLEGRAGPRRAVFFAAAARRRALRRVRRIARRVPSLRLRATTSRWSPSASAKSSA
jgi:branched-chain amino acid transport system permease protein